jgi:hypothetical protein
MVNWQFIPVIKATFELELIKIINHKRNSIRNKLKINQKKHEYILDKNIFKEILPSVSATSVIIVVTSISASTETITRKVTTLATLIATHIWVKASISAPRSRLSPTYSDSISANHS